MQNDRIHNLKLAEKGVWVSIVAYILLSVGNLVVAELAHSDALRANGFDNVTDILSNIALLIGLRVSRIPADSDHIYGHWKVESVTSLIASFLMALVGFEVLLTTIQNLISHKTEAVNALGATVGVFSALIIFGVYLYTRRLAKSVNSEALMAASKDNISDAFTSLGSALAVLFASFHLQILDQMMALIICSFIFKTAYDIFRKSAFSLTDGFDEKLLESYRQAIEQVDKVVSVKLLRGRNYGSNIFLDVVITMSPDLSVYESHTTTEEIENLLREKFDVYDTDVHVEPAVLPDDETTAALSLKILGLEEDFISGRNLSALTGIDFQHLGPAISPDADLLNSQAQRISQKTFLISYDTDNLRVAALWRRINTWQCLYRMTTPKN